MSHEKPIFQGVCEGNSLHITTAQTSSECLSLCKDESQCNWYNFNTIVNACILNEDCTTLDSTQEDFLTGQRECPLSDEDLVFIVGGFDDTLGTETSDTEIVALNNGSTTWEKPIDYPTASWGIVGTIFDEKFVACGGSPQYNGDCFAFDFATKVWLPFGSLYNSRAFSSGVMINETHWWISGGKISGLTDTTEIFDLASQTSTPYVQLPIPSRYHHVLKVDDDSYFFCCGEFMGKDSLIFDMKHELWIGLPQSQFSHSGGVAGNNRAFSEVWRFSRFRVAFIKFRVYFGLSWFRENRKMQFSPQSVLIIGAEE